MTLTRRRLLCHSSLIPLASLPLLQGCGETIVTCADPELLTRGEAQMRETLEYIAVSENPDQSCANCQFLHPAEKAGCGGCEILAGHIDLTGFCTSWAPKR